MEKYDEDLNTTLIFVSSVVWCSGVRVLTLSQAGLFSAITSAFILDVQPQLQPDPNDETAALLRVLIHKIDNTTFGNDTPTLPQWTGPPHTIVQVQAILYASLAASLLSAFLAMLGKQWLNRYASTDLRGTAIERSQNRQRKLDGIITWYFDQVMQSLPLMLQAALLLLGGALSRYLWEVNTTVASVVLCVTLFGIVFYISIVAAGAASESCPYQTPGSQALRYLRPKVHRILHSATSTLRNAFPDTKTAKTIRVNVQWHHPWWSRGHIMPFLKDMVREIPQAIVIDARRLGLAIIRRLAAAPAGFLLFGSMIIALLVSLARGVRNRLRGASSTPEQGLGQHMTVLDSRCILWMLQTSLDKSVLLSTLKHLVTMTALASLDPALITGCLDAFIGCMRGGIGNHEVVIMRELEQLATVAALCFFNIISHLLVVDPASSGLEDARQRCFEIFPALTNFHGHYHTMNAACCLLVPRQRRPTFQWSDYKPSTHEHSTVAHGLARLARFKYRTTEKVKVPRLILRFALHSLSLYPPPPTSVIADCLSIIAIDLGCDVPDTGTVTSDGR